ncbi:MAG: NADH-quinone oxidoreductase subunit L [Candidatus Bathyarchaeia archaeon]
MIEAWLCWLTPISGALLTPILARLGYKVRDYGAVAFSFLAALFASRLLPIAVEGVTVWEKYSWMPIYGAPIYVGVLVDPLSVIMANVVSWISFLIMLYSLEYMHGEPGLTRYWFLMNFFIGNMLLLVLSDNMLQMFFGWEGVGLCSYGLIGFWYRDEKKYWVGTPPDEYPPSHSGMKAFITTRMGDVGMLVAMLAIYSYSGTFSIPELQSNTVWASTLLESGLLTPILLLMLLGPIGKSAQFPLHEWLPEAMAGPTSVSALIHAATMVKAGVYLIARIVIVAASLVHVIGFEAFHVFFVVVAWIGGFTAFLAATQAVVARELKKVLAYSTISQIGYMMLALGAAGVAADFAEGLTAGIFHLVSHAVFKASLFLASGAILHVCETKYMDEMGGLKRYMPVTFASMLIAALSLSGVPPLLGFWSKEAVLKICFETGDLALFILSAATAAITFFYSLRMISMTFLYPKSEHLQELEVEGLHIHEVSPIMWIPYGLLAVSTLILGVSGRFVESFFHESLSHLIAIGRLEAVAEPHGIGFDPSIASLLASVSALIVGGLPGYWLYVARKADPCSIVEGSSILKAVWSFLWNRWYMNRVYYILFVNLPIALAKIMNRWIEIGLFNGLQYGVSWITLRLAILTDRFMEVSFFNGLQYGVAGLVARISRASRLLQTGSLNINMYQVSVILVLILFMLLIFMGVW